MYYNTDKDELYEELISSVKDLPRLHSRDHISKRKTLIIKIEDDKIDIIVKSFSILSGVIAIILAILAILEFRNSIIQRDRELRFQQATIARGLVDSVLEDKDSWDALLMIDYAPQGKEFEITSNQKVLVQISNITKALSLDDRNLNEEEIFIRERIDRLLFLLGRVQASINIGMIQEQDAIYPLEYYILRTCNYRSGIEPYIASFASKESNQFIKRYWRNCP